MLTAIINARCSSSRLPLKHFYKIGEQYVIETILDTLLKNKNIKEIFIASGPIQQNILLKKRLSKFKKYKNIKFYFHKNENNVTERVFYLLKKISNPYIVLISGDCCLIENEFINRIYDLLKKNSYFDFVRPQKKIIHEGIKIFRKKIWNKVYRMSNYTRFKENPGLVVKEKNKNFKIIHYKPKNYEIGKKYRISVDTLSDLDFFNYIYHRLKLKNKSFNLKNLLKLKKVTILNSHVAQRKPYANYNQKISILTSVNKDVGLGHFLRSKTIEREIKETLTSNVNFHVINSKFSKYINFEGVQFSDFKKLFKNKFFLNSVLIIDLPQKYLAGLTPFLKKIKKIIIIDKLLNLKKAIYLIPSARKIHKQSNLNKIYSGSKYLILNREIIKQKHISLNNRFKIKKLLLIGGSFSVNDEIISFIKNNHKSLLVVLGPYVNNNNFKLIKSFKVKFIFNPENMYKLMYSSEKIYCRFGVSTYEAIAMNKKPIVFYKSEDNSRKKDINFLYHQNLITKFDFKDKKYKKTKKISVDQGLKNFTNILRKNIC